MGRLLRSGSLAAAVLLLATGSASAQATTATLKGVVVDISGAPLPGVPVKISSATQGSAASTVVSDLEGRYKFQLLPPADDYMASVAYPGYATTVLGPIGLDPGKTTIQNIVLQKAEGLTQKVEVVAHGSIVDTESTKSSTTFNSEFVEGLPMIGHSYLDILTLTPGVTDTNGDGNPNVQGARETGLQYRLDGGNITDPESGTFGQHVNFDAIEEVEVITAGASAEYGRADGGFANIITKSGGNDFEGSFKLFWRGNFLDGDGATENRDTVVQHSPGIQSESRRLDGYVTLGGAIVQDKLWYFGSLEQEDRQDFVSLAGTGYTLGTTGHTTLGKLTWQVNADNKLALEYNDDPRTYSGLFLGLGVNRDSDALIETTGRTPQLRWTSILSPDLVMETLFTHYDSGRAYIPVSNQFERFQVTTAVQQVAAGKSVVARYPAEQCSYRRGGQIPNCDPSQGRPRIYQVNVRRNTITGPFPFTASDSRVRNAVKSDLTHTVQDVWGEHQVKAGLEFAAESYRNRPWSNPYFVNDYGPCRGFECFTGRTTALPPGAIIGTQLLVASIPATLDERADGFNSSAYLTDAWKPRPNLTLQVGLRMDQEAIDAPGFTPFNPREEKGKSIKIVEALCADAERVESTGAPSNSGVVCNTSLRLPGQPPYGGNLVYQMDANTPEWLRRFDRNANGVFDSGADGAVWNDPFTVYTDRLPSNFSIKNTNLSPRFSAAWDPWADGRTKVFTTWGRYYDRLFLQTVSGENRPDTLAFAFQSSLQTYSFDPNSLSQNVATFSINQVDRNLRTPYTDVFTLGVERELAAEWSIRLTYTKRLAWDLLQDVDLNHVLCTQYKSEFGISPKEVCPLYTDANGKVHISQDLFGAGYPAGPNLAPDLYDVSPMFDQILHVGNFNSSNYTSYEAVLTRRLHRNWQMQASYTYSRAFGQAETYNSSLGNDPATKDHENGYLDYDQRHRAILLIVARLPGEVRIGSSITWESGTPFSVLKRVADQDNLGNYAVRTIYPTGRRNDQRNGNFWTIDVKLTRDFRIGGVQATGDLSVNNLLNQDDATLGAFLPLEGIQIQGGPQGLRRFGRYWEVGLALNF